MNQFSKIEKALSVVDTAKKIYQGMTKGVSELKDLEMRSQFVELKSALLDSQEAILNLKREFESKDDEIKKLKDALKLKAKLVLFEHHGHYHRADKNGTPYGEPYCSRCWEVDHKTVSVSRKSKCPECGAELWRAIPLRIKNENS